MHSTVRPHHVDRMRQKDLNEELLVVGKTERLMIYFPKSINAKEQYKKMCFIRELKVSKTSDERNPRKNLSF